MTKYQFRPTKFGFCPPHRMPPQLKDYLGIKTYVKIIAIASDGSFWYKACSQPYGDDRWSFTNGLYDIDKMQPSGRREPGHMSNVSYIGCITSEHFAVGLLIHLFGTTTNKNTIEHGTRRLKAKSLKPYFHQNPR